MRQVFLLERTEMDSLRKGEPFVLALGSGEKIELRYDRPMKRAVAVAEPVSAKNGYRARRKHALAFKKQVAAFTKAHKKMARAAIARKFDISESLVHQWKKRYA
jgi:hypothetical protein